MNSIFVTGTDTEIGKTYTSCLLLHHLHQCGFNTIGVKPIASGCTRIDNNQLRNDDALQLQRAASVELPYDVINPFSFEPPVAPHIAAAQLNVHLSSESIIASLKKTTPPNNATIRIIEGVGGWSVPLNEKGLLLSDVISYLKLPTILVVGIKLGCLNHALLTHENITSKNVPLIGWIANCNTPETHMEQENIQTLKNHLNTPLIGIVPYNAKTINALDTDAIKAHIFK